MRIEQLQYFVTAADVHSMQKAGEVEHTTVQNISKNIKMLEKELNAVLFVRNKSGVYLTASGDKLYAEAVKVLNRVDYIRKEFGVKKDKLNEGRISRFNVLIAFANGEFFSETYMKFVKKYHIDEARYDVHDAMVVNRILRERDEKNNYDVIITNIPNGELAGIKTDNQHYEIFVLQECTLGIRISRQHPLAKERSISFKQLNTFPMVQMMTENGDCSQIIQLVQKEGFVVKPVFRTTSMDQCMRFIRYEMGYAFSVMPEATEIEKSGWEETVFIPLNEKIPMSNIVLIHENLRNHVLYHSLIQELKRKNKDMRRY